MSENQRVGGIVQLQVNGVTYLVKGPATYNLGNPKTESVLGVDKFHGFKDVPQAAFIECEVTDDGSIDLDKFTKQRGATVTARLANGKTVVLHNASFCGDGTGSSEEGQIAARWEGETADEQK